MKILLILWSVMLLASCKTNKHVPLESCHDYDMILKEFSSKFKVSDSDCYIYNFDKDSTMYIDYNEFGGKTKFMDYRLNEILYYQDKLTNEYLDLPELSKNCLKQYSKEDISKLFGKPTIVNNVYNYYKYYIVVNQNCNYCRGLEYSGSDCPNYLSFYFSDDGENCNQFTINIFQL
jgi:hypothetical protein